MCMQLFAFFPFFCNGINLSDHRNNNNDNTKSNDNDIDDHYYRHDPQTNLLSPSLYVVLYI